MFFFLPFLTLIDENITFILEWDAPLLLANNIFSTSVGVKQNTLGALYLLLDKQFGLFTFSKLVTFFFNSNFFFKR